MNVETKDQTPTLHLPLAPGKLLREKQIVGDILPFSRATFWNYVKSGDIKPGWKVGPKMTVWRSEDIQEFIDSIFSKN